MCLLQCKHVSFSYEGRPAVADLPFEVHEGDYLAIVGENGAGKSTLVIPGIISLQHTQEGSSRGCYWRVPSAPPGKSMMRLDQTSLNNKVSRIITKMDRDGTMSKISKKYFEEDISKNKR